MPTFSIVEEVENKSQILSLLLGINTIMPNSNCVITCCENTKKYINNCPINLDINLYFLDISKKTNRIDYISYIKNLISNLTYSINNFEDVIHLNQSLIMINKIKINDDIKNQGFAFVKKKTHPKNLKEYNFDFNILYLNNIAHLNKVETLINSDLNFIDNNILTYENDSYNLDNQKFLFLYYRKLPYKMSKDVEYFIDEKILLTTEDFFRSENSLKPSDIEYNFKINENFISFIQIKHEGKSPMKELEHAIINTLCKSKPNYFYILNLHSSNKINFTIPNKNGIGIWDRSQDIHFLENIIELIVEKYNDYFSLKKENVDFYSFGISAIYEKEHYYLINKTIQLYPNIKLCNFSDTLIDTFNKYKLNYTFTGFIPLYPNILFDFLKDNINTPKTNDIHVVENNPTNVDDYKTFIEALNKSKFCRFNNCNVQLIASALSLNVIPIIKNIYNIEFLEKDKHYFHFDININEIDYESVIKEFKTNKLIIKSIEDFLKNLLE